MGEYTFKDNQEIVEKKKKKGLSGGMKFLISFLVIFVLVPGLIVGTAFACFYDNSHREIKVKEGTTTKTIINDVMTSSLDHTTSEYHIDLALLGDHMNQLLQVSLEGKMGPDKPIRNFYVDAMNGVLDFQLELGWKFLQTHITLKTRLDIITGEEYDTLKFSIIDLQVGRIRGFLALKDMLLKYVPVDALNQMLIEAGLHLELDVANLAFTYTSTDFYNDIVVKIGGEGGDLENYIQIFSELMNKHELRTFYTENSTVFGVKVPIDKLQITETTHHIHDYFIPVGPFVTNYINRDVTLLIKSFLDEGKLSDQDDLSLVAAYMIGGYSSLNSSDKEKMNQYGYSLFGSAYPSDDGFYDYNLPEEQSLKYIIDEQTEYQVAYNPGEDFVSTVTTDDINNMLTHSKTMGAITFFTSNEGDLSRKNYKVNYICLDNLTSIIKDNRIFIVLSIDFNGYPGHMTLQLTPLAETPEDPFGQLKLQIDCMYLGDIQVSAETQAAFVDTITDSFDTGLFTISDSVIYMNVSGIMNDDGVFKEYYDISFGFFDNELDSAGAIAIIGTKK